MNNDSGRITIIAGSRQGATIQDVSEAVQRCGWRISRVISGTARGVDQLGEQWAAEQGIPVSRFPAEWDRFGRSAGYRRNIQMAENAQCLVALWDGESPGTRHMINIARQRGLAVFVYPLGSGPQNRA